MNRFFILVLITLLISACNNQDPKPGQPSENTRKYSPELSQALDSTLENYYALSEVFVNWDSTRIDQALKKLKLSFDKLNERMDSSSSQQKKGMAYFINAKNSLNQIPAAIDLTAKRHVFHTLSENFFRFLENIQYDGNTVYLQECTMPFNDTGRGVWLSRTEEKRNPYLGLYHPYYKAGMLECGTLEGKIDFTSN